MKLIKPSYQIWEQESSLEGIYRQIEKASRICYKSESNITEDSAKPMVDRLISSKHLSMLEHGTVYLIIPFEYVDLSNEFKIPIVSDNVEKYKNNPYTRWHLRDDGFSQLAFITTNYRTLIENNWLDDLKYLHEPTEYHVKRVTVHFVCDRATAQEITRHRTGSFAMESQRYCNYSKDKFNSEITCIIPCWTSLTEDSYKSFSEIISKTPLDNYKEGETEFLMSCIQSEQHYFMLLNKGWKPEQARTVLPNACKTELVMTGFVDKSGWLNFFSLRSRLAKTGRPHPQAQELADPLMNEFVKRGIMEPLL